jgi:aspartyl-tRNA(Asn)/glutamyl-tRNA(Gln) amidotransferase subunit A
VIESAEERLEKSLAAIAEHGERTNAFIAVYADTARAEARALDEERRRGSVRGPLHGMPMSIKDLVDIAGQPTTAASRVRAGHVAKADAPIIRRLRAAGVVIIGKTNLHEFALGPTNEDSAWGPVRNPVDASRIAGGSSGGSAAAVALGMGEASVGSDTGGSIRIPAAACGVVGLKPSSGEVPLEGVVPLSTTLDNGGPITRTVGDAAVLWSVLADRPLPRLERPALTTLTFGELGGYFTSLLEPEVRAAFGRAVARLRAGGAKIEARTVTGTGTITQTYGDISLPEAANWHTQTLISQPNDYNPTVRSRLEFGRTIPAVNYLHAMEDREVLRAAVDAALDKCDALLLPTLPIVAPPLGSTEAVFDGPNGGERLPVRAALLRLTQLFNVTGHPVITIPIETSGLPVGLQIVGHRDRTADLLAAAMACEA